MERDELTIESRLAALPAPLLAWYRKNARDLPWRRTRDPYAILVSEVMLQQTRVAAVLGYYARFLEAFPTVEALAAAPEDRLLSLWQGLGYYSRARNLQRSARLAVERGGFPGSRQELLTLPGVGEYTAAAVASAAFGERCAAVDGNVLRVAARLTDCREDVLSPAVRRDFQARLQAVFPEAEARIFNQALMELGATVCLPNGAPRCDRCPAAALCLGRERGTAQDLPVRGGKKERRVEELTVFLLLRQGRTALRKRPASGLLASLWEFPNVPGCLDEAGAARTLSDWGLTPRSWESRLTARHLFTHVEWRMTGYVLTVSGDGPEDFSWVDREGLSERAVPSAFARLRSRVDELLGEGAAE